MNLILLPILTILVLGFAYYYLGRLVATVGDGDGHYSTDPTAGAALSAAARLRDLGVLGIPLLLAGAAFGLRFGWAPAFLWILLASTTVGAACTIAQSRLVTPAALVTVNTLSRIAISALLALLWAGLAARGPQALLAFFVLYLTADRLIPFLVARGADLAGGLLLIAAVGVLFAAVGVASPLALIGPVRILLGPYHRLTAVGPLFFYALLFVMLIQKKRAGRLVDRPAYGAVGALLLGSAVLFTFLTGLIAHPVMAVPRLRQGNLLVALPFLAAALPFGAALAPLGNNPLAPTPLRSLYAVILLQAVAAVAFLMSVISRFSTPPSWAHFFAGQPGAVSLLLAGISGNQHLLAFLGLGPWVSQVLLAGLLLLTAAALESQQERLGRGPFFGGPIQPLMATALLGAALWMVHGLDGTDEVLMGALLGVGAAWALLLQHRAFPRFMVSSGYVLLALTDTALIVIGWTDPGQHPVRAALSVAVMIIEAAAATRLWRTLRS